jgi:hypothetical protein
MAQVGNVGCLHTPEMRTSGHTAHARKAATSVEGRVACVAPMMRLIARLKHRDVGVFVTTSYFEQQVQQELIEDGHPVLLISGGDIARLLIRAEFGTPGTGSKLDGLLDVIRLDAAAS